MLSLTIQTIYSKKASETFLKLLLDHILTLAPFPLAKYANLAELYGLFVASTLVELVRLHGIFWWLCLAKSEAFEFYSARWCTTWFFCRCVTKYAHDLHRDAVPRFLRRACGFTAIHQTICACDFVFWRQWRALFFEYSRLHFWFMVVICVADLFVGYDNSVRQRDAAAFDQPETRAAKSERCFIVRCVHAFLLIFTRNFHAANVRQLLISVQHSAFRLEGWILLTE